MSPDALNSATRDEPLPAMLAIMGEDKAEVNERGRWIEDAPCGWRITDKGRSAFEARS